MVSRPSATVALGIAALCASQLVLQAVGHCACAPCLCELVSNAQVAKVARTCAEGYERTEVATNRTLQLLRSITEITEQDIARCDLRATGLKATIEKARFGYQQTVWETSRLRKELLGSSTSTKPAEEYGRRIQDRLDAVSAVSFAKGTHLSEGLAVVLQDCFDEVPASPAAISSGAPATASRVAATGGAAAAPPTAALADENSVALAWGLTAMSALSTLLGASLVGCATPKNLGYLSFLEAFTAGVMLQGSLTGLSTKAAFLTADSMHPTVAFWTILLCFFGGAGTCVLLEIGSHRFLGQPPHSIPGTADEGARDAPVPKPNGAPSSDSEASLAIGCEKAAAREVEIAVQGGSPAGDWEESSGSAQSSASDEDSEMAVPTAAKSETGGKHPQPSVFVVVAGVTLHNVAEGMATFTAALISSRLGIGLAVAMVLHNIPEGISIALPYYHSTGSRLCGFLWAAVSGGAEVLAALAVYLLYLLTESSIQQTAFACLFAVASGMMTFIALYELYPSALAVSRDSRAVPGAGLFLGLFVMQITLGQLGIP